MVLCLTRDGRGSRGTICGILRILRFITRTPAGIGTLATIPWRGRQIDQRRPQTVHAHQSITRTGSRPDCPRRGLEQRRARRLETNVRGTARAVVPAVSTLPAGRIFEAFAKMDEGGKPVG